jgi:hypothetical protein
MLFPLIYFAGKSAQDVSVSAMDRDTANSCAESGTTALQYPFRFNGFVVDNREVFYATEATDRPEHGQSAC